MKRWRIANLRASVLVCVFLPAVMGFGQTVSKPDPAALLHFRQGLDALKANTPDKAEAEFNKVVELDPRNAEAWGKIGVIRFTRRDYSGAAEVFRQALRIQPALWRVQAFLGICEKQLGRADEARRLLTKSFPHLEDTRLRVMAGLELAEIEFGSGNPVGAAGSLDTLEKIAPENADVHFATYRVHEELASRELEFLAALAPDSARMHQVIAQHLIQIGSLQDAISQYRKAIEIEPGLPGIHVELGQALLTNGKIAEAIKELEAELALNPNDVQAECKLAYIFKLKGELDAAYSHYTRAVQLDPNQVEAQAGLAEVLTAKGQSEKALQCYMIVERLDPMNAAAHYRLARAYKEQGREDDAARELASFRRTQEVRTRVARLHREMGKPPDAGDALDAPAEDKQR
jgi:tetratricopeptide (TPR) repeat protein